ncbi:guanine nucleotide-binding protein [Aureococcus anophagefferens]|nr:guanine nucleotide-binding protein [Aureococcus anophagefferens]
MLLATIRAFRAPPSPFLRRTTALFAAKGKAKGKNRKVKEETPEHERSVAGAINWYPGHIARAERELRDYLKRRRRHRARRYRRDDGAPDVSEWIGARPRVVVFTFADLAPANVVRDWKEELSRVPAAKSENKAGVTRSLNWVRSKPSTQGKGLPFELLDSPGIIPAKQLNQRMAARLAICGDIGDASYDTRLVAEALVEELTTRRDERYARDGGASLLSKYGVDPDVFAPDVYVDELANLRYEGDAGTAAMAILTDFRAGRLGKVALEGPKAPQRAAPEPPADAPKPKPVVVKNEDAKRPLSDEEREMAERRDAGDWVGW